MEIKISPQAHTDINDICNYVAKDGESIAKAQASAIFDVIEKLAMFPNIGIDLNKYVSAKTDYRFTIVKNIYLVFYKITADAVEIIRILRGEQNYISALGLTEKPDRK